MFDLIAALCIAALLIYISILLKRIEIKMASLDDALTALETEVTALTTAEQSAVALLNGISQQLKDILASGGNPAQQVARVNALVAAIDADTADLASAVVANTPPVTPA